MATPRPHSRSRRAASDACARAHMRRIKPNVTREELPSPLRSWIRQERGGRRKVAMWTTEQFKQLTPDVFAKRGMPALAYLKQVTVDGNQAWEVRAADGPQLALMTDRNVAIATCR